MSYAKTATLSNLLIIVLLLRFISILIDTGKVQAWNDIQAYAT